jgi:hypothetical protein
MLLHHPDLKRWAKLYRLFDLASCFVSGHDFTFAEKLVLSPRSGRAALQRRVQVVYLEFRAGFSRRHKTVIQSFSAACSVVPYGLLIEARALAPASFAAAEAGP